MRIEKEVKAPDSLALARRDSIRQVDSIRKAEKFLDIKCRKAGLVPDAVVIVATVRALKYNGGVPKAELSKENLEALKIGSANLEAHIDNIRKFGLPVVVAINRFHTDTDAELSYVEEICKSKGADFSLSEVFAKGGEGGIDLANKVVAACEKEKNFKFTYESDLSIKEKIEAIATKIYGASEVKYDAAALKNISEIEALDPKYSTFPICVAKTQYSLSDDASKLGRPKDFTLTVREVKLSAGAEFIVVLTGAIMTMPGLPKAPSAFNIDVDDDGNITGLF